MADYIDREEILAHLEETKQGTSTPAWKLLIDALLESYATFPAADVVEVVRCKECVHQKKFWHPDRRMAAGGVWFYRCELNDDQFVYHVVDGQNEEYCSAAKRKENCGGNFD